MQTIWSKYSDEKTTSEKNIFTLSLSFGFMKIDMKNEKKITYFSASRVVFVLDLKFY